MKLLVTGITGFLGKNLFRGTPENCNLLAIANSQSVQKSDIFNNLRYLDCNFENFSKYSDEIIQFNPEIVLNLAWKGIPDFSLSNCKYNLEKSIKFFDFILEETKCSKFISMGSCAEYFNPIGKTDETEEKKPKDDFTWAKISLDKIIREKCKLNNINYINLKLFYVYGKYQRDNSLIPYLIAAFKNNQKPEINNSLDSHDFIHVDDVTSAIWGVIKNNIPGGSYNLGYGASISNHKIQEIIKSEMNIPDNSELEEDLDKKNIINFYANNNKLIKEIDWIPKVDITEGIRRCILNKS